MRLHKFLASSGVWSRRDAERHILLGHVKLNGDVVSNLGVIIDPLHDLVEWQNELGWHTVKKTTKFVVYAINKPIGYTTTVRDPHATKTIMELVPNEPRVVPIGRLDKDSTGLLLLTNNGDLVQKLTHPSHHVAKTYHIVCQIPPNYDRTKLSSNLDKVRHGVMLDGKLTAPAIINGVNLNNNQNTVSLNIIISEGMRRQIRRVMQKIGLNVIQLSRTSIGKLTLQQLNLSPGQYCELTDKEIGLAIYV